MDSFSPSAGPPPPHQGKHDRGEPPIAPGDIRGANREPTSWWERLKSGLLRRPLAPEELLSGLASLADGKVERSPRFFLLGGEPSFVCQEGDVRLTVRTGPIGFGRHVSYFSSVALDFVPVHPIKLSLSPDGFIPKAIEGLFQIRDIFGGEKAFDRTFTVHASNEELARHVFGDDAFQRQLCATPSLSIRTYVGRETSADLPEGGYRVELSLPYQAPDVDTLHRLLMVGKTLAHRLEVAGVMRAHREQLLLPDELIEQGLSGVLKRIPALAADRETVEAVKRQLEWGVRQEAQVCHETIQNLPDDKIPSAMLERCLLLEGREAWGCVAPVTRGSAGWMMSPHEVAEEVATRVVQAIPLELSERDRAALRDSIASVTAAETVTCRSLVQDASSNERRNALASRTNPSIVVKDRSGQRAEACIDTPRWGEWYPGLSSGGLTLKQVYDTLPGFSPDKVPQIVRQFENPESPVALPGAVTLKQHDYIHVILGRGLLDQDEAFVIAFTMASACLGAKSELSENEVVQMLEAFSKLYPEPYRIVEPKLSAFRHGVAAAQALAVVDLSTFDFDAVKDRPLSEIRRMVLRSPEELREWNRQEQQLIPGTLESARLPV